MISVPDGKALLLSGGYEFNNVEKTRLLYRSTDGGAAWNLVSLPFPSVEWQVNLFASIGDTIWGLSSATPDTQPVNTIGSFLLPRKIYRSSDGGQTWTGRLINIPASIMRYVRAFIAGKSQLFVVADGEALESFERVSYLYRSTDGGVNWSSGAKGLPIILPVKLDLPNAPPGVGGVSSIAATVMDANESLFLAHAGRGEFLTSPEAGIYRSRDGGETWTKIFEDNQRPCLRIAASGKYIAAATADPRGSDVRIFVSRDGGETWKQCGETFAATRVHSLKIDDEQRLFVGDLRGLFYADISQKLPRWSALHNTATRYNVLLAHRGQLFISRLVGLEQILSVADTQPLRTALVTGAQDAAGVEARSAMLRCSPNPASANSSAELRYRLPSSGSVRITLWNALGQRVATLVEANQASGEHIVLLSLAGFAAGVYTLRLESGGVAESARIVVAP